MRRLIERLLARFGFVRAEPPKYTVAEMAAAFGQREAMARFESYHTGYAQGEINGRMALAYEMHVEFGFGEQGKHLTDVELQRVIARQVH